jgi:hypothetical protein
LKAKPAAFRTKLDAEPLAISEASMCMYAGYMANKQD